MEQKIIIVSESSRVFLERDDVLLFKKRQPHYTEKVIFLLLPMVGVSSSVEDEFSK